MRAFLDLVDAIAINTFRLGPPNAPKSERNCDPYDVARLLMDADHEPRRRELWKRFPFIDDVKFAMFDLEASPLLRKMAKG